MILHSLKRYPQYRTQFNSFKGFMNLDQVDLFISHLNNDDDSYEAECFVFVKQGEVIGRVVLQVSQANSKEGFFALFYLLPQWSTLFDLIWKECEEWFRLKNVKTLIGPYLFSTYLPYRYRVDEVQDSFFWEPKKENDELNHFLRNKFLPYQHYSSYFFDNLEDFDGKGKKEMKSLNNLKITHKDVSHIEIKNHLQRIYDLSMIGFAQAPLFRSISFNTFKKIYLSLLEKINLDLSCFQVSPQNEIIGFNFSFCDGEQIVVKTVCVDPEYRGLGLLNSGIRFALDQAKIKYPQIKKLCLALIHEENGASNHYAQHQSISHSHRYILISKDLF